MSILRSLSVMAAGGVPGELLAQMPARLLDILGICVRATTLNTSRAVSRYSQETGGAPQSTAIGVAVRLPSAEAAFVNGVLAHSLDYDDTHLPSILHPSASIVPAVIAAAENEEGRDADISAAIAVGTEVCVRLGMGGFDPVSRQSVFFERGQHATSICGAVGSAAAACRARGMNAEITLHAMAIACSMASGILESNRTGGSVKRLHCGWAARAGVTSAELALRGVTGSETAVEGRFGLLQAFLGSAARCEVVTEEIGERWFSEDVFFKPYPANHFTHAGIDAALTLRQGGLRPENVKSATLAVPPPVLRTIGEPLTAKRAPETGYQAQFSGPYTVAAALCGGTGLGLGLDDFTDALAKSPQRRELMKRINVVADPALLKIYPYQFPATLTVTTGDDRTLTEAKLVNRGGPGMPLSKDELAQKFHNNVSGLLKPASAEEITERLGSSAPIGNLGKVMSLLTRA